MTITRFLAAGAAALLAAAHPEGRNYTRGAAPHTEPVPLHPGARRYYETGTPSTGPGNTGR